MIVNADSEKVEKDMNNKTVLQYWAKNPNTLIVRSNDVREAGIIYSCDMWGVKNNTPTTK